MYEADFLCQRIAVINHGSIVALDTPQELKNVVSDLSVVEIELFGVPEAALEAVRALPDVDSISIDNHEQRQTLSVQTRRGSEAVPHLVSALQGYRVGRVQVREPTLEDAYVRLVGGETGS